ncbi:MAG: flavin reductase family protein [Oscillospiraceae bacterium]|nr:flavin reductase family protein [Oscillospiraceae bacterium]
MAKVVWKGAALLAPLPPALVTCAYGDGANIMTAAWTGILNSQPPKTYISLRPSRLTHDLIGDTRTFALNLTTRSLVRAADFCGVKSGRDTDKLAALSLHTEPGPQTGCPMLAESPVSIECRVYDIVPLGSHDMFLADIVSVCVDEQYIDADGKLRLSKAHLAAYAHGAYYALGEQLGTFGFSVKKKKAKRK